MSEAPSKPLPSKIGRYRIFSKLAAGGMATVYLARSENDAGFEKIVALKVIHDHLAGEKAFVDMFLDEARIAANINHPNVATVFDFGNEKGVYYLAMEYLLGEPLGRIIRAVANRKNKDEVQRLPWYVARVLADACEGLHAAHELRDAEGNHLRVVHRDVSPENILVTYDGAVKLLDFGVAKAAQRIHETKVSKIKGKFAYVSPEQVRNEDLDRRTDLWGIGVCLWESLTLRRLFRRDSDAATLLAVVNDEIPPPSMLRGWVPPELDEIVLRALEREPERRYPSARAMGLELRTFLTQSGATLGIAEIGEWMESLFPTEKEKRVERVRQARQGKISNSLIPVVEESNSDGTMPSVSMAVSPGDAPAPTGTSLRELKKTLTEAGREAPSDVVALITMDVCEALQAKPTALAPEQVRISPDGRISLAPPFDPARGSDAVRSVQSCMRPFLPAGQTPISQVIGASEFRDPGELGAALQNELDPLARGGARKALVGLLQGSLPISSRMTARPPRRPTPTDQFAQDPLQVSGPSPTVSWDDELDDGELMKGVRNRGGFRALLVIAVLLAIAAAGIAVFEPELANDLLVRAGVVEPPEPEPEPIPEPEPEPRGIVALHVETENARVFHFVGRSPASIRGLPVRDTHGFIAVVEGRPFAHSTVGPDASWTDAPEPTFEFALQVPEEAREPGELQEAPASEDARIGMVRIVTDPPSAKVFHQVGIGPELTLDDLPIDQPLELLILAEGHQPHREIVDANAWPSEGPYRLERTIALTEAPQKRRRHRRRRDPSESEDSNEPEMQAEPEPEE